MERYTGVHIISHLHVCELNLDVYFLISSNFYLSDWRRSTYQLFFVLIISSNITMVEFGWVRAEFGHLSIFFFQFLLDWLEWIKCLFPVFLLFFRFKWMRQIWMTMSEFQGQNKSLIIKQQHYNLTLSLATMEH